MFVGRLLAVSALSVPVRRWLQRVEAGAGGEGDTPTGV